MGLNVVRDAERGRAVVGDMHVVAERRQQLGEPLAASSLSSTTSTRLETPRRRGERGRGGALRRVAAARVLCGRRQLDDELAALAGAGALGVDPAAMQLDEAAHDRQPEAETAFRAVERLRLLHERSKMRASISGAMPMP